jgi:hypothetical protein
VPVIRRYPPMRGVVFYAVHGCVESHRQGRKMCEMQTEWGSKQTEWGEMQTEWGKGESVTVAMAVAYTFRALRKPYKPP